LSNKTRQERAPGAILGVKRKVTAAEKLATLELYIRHHNTNIVGEKLGISGAAVRDRLYAMNVRLLPQGFPHHNDVVAVNGKEFIRKLKRELRAAVGDQDVVSIMRPWTAAEEALLHTAASHAQLAAQLNRTVRAVRRRRSKLRGPSGKIKRRWAPWEDAIVLQYQRSVASVATELGRTVSSVNTRRSRLRQEAVQAASKQA
jgi:hypothetical protein